jgi:hypothetical protein
MRRCGETGDKMSGRGAVVTQRAGTLYNCRMHHAPWALLGAMLFLAAGLGAQTDDASEIRRRRESSNAAIARHDTAGIAAILAPNVVVVTSNSVHAVSRDTNVTRFAEQFRARPDVVYRRTPDSVAVFTPWRMASERGRWTGSWMDRDGRIEIGGVYFAKWRQVNGAWLVESETYVPEYCRGGVYCTTVPSS